MKQVIKTIPKGWVEFKIDDLGELFNGLTGKNKSDFGMGKPYIPYMNIFSSSRININKYDFVKINDGESQNKVKYGDIFFTTSSETPHEVGMSSVLLDEVDELYLNSFCFGLRLFNFNYLIPEFAQYIFRYHVVRKNISNLAQGSTRFNLTKRFFLNLNLVLPPINEQKKIVEILSKVDDDINRTEEIIKKTENLKKGLMQDFFDKKNNTNLENIRIGDFGDIITGNTPSTSNTEYYGKDFLWVSPKDIGHSKYIVNTEKKLSIFGFEKTRKLPSGAVLVVCIGSTIGKIAIASKEMSTNQQINSIIVDKKFDNEYIYYCLLYNKNKIIENRSTQAVPILNKTSFSNILIDVTNNKTDQKYISNILSSIDDKIEINKQTKNKLIQLKKGLMNDLLSGEVRVKL